MGPPGNLQVRVRGGTGFRYLPPEFVTGFRFRVEISQKNRGKANVHNARTLGG